MKNSRLRSTLENISIRHGGNLPGVQLIEVISDKQVLIENHCGICKYTRETICVKSNIGVIKIEGQYLFVKKLSKDQVFITGRINAITIIRGQGNENR